MRRTICRSLAAAAAAAALILIAGCSLIPGLGADTAPPPAAPAAQPSAAASSTKSATGTPAATTTPAISKTTSGSAFPVPVPPKPADRISSDVDGVELRDLQTKGALVVDLRSKDDFKKEHIRDAQNVPMADFADTAEGWSKSRAVVVYDKSGVVGQSAQTWLESNGFTRIYHLFRGLDGYDATLVGTNPTPIPPRRPVLYYFNTDWDAMSGEVPIKIINTAGVDEAAKFMKELRAEFGDDVEFHEYDVSTISGISKFLEFNGTFGPMFRLVTHDGRAEQYEGAGTIEIVRAHLRKSVAEYKAETQP